MLIRTGIFTVSLCLVGSFFSFDTLKAIEMNVEYHAFIKLKGANETDRVFLIKPTDISITKTFPVEDFMLADFSKSGEDFMRVYAGNAPGFPSDRCSGSVNDRTINGLPSKEIRCRDGSLEVLVALGVRNGRSHHQWPLYIHFMLQQIEEFSIIGADIINSIQVKK